VRLLAALAIALLLAGCGGTQTTITTVTSPGSATTAPAVPDVRSTITITTPTRSGDGTRTFVMIGDSLAVATAIDLPEALPGFNVVTDAQGGRITELGLQAFRQRTGPVSVLAFSLFTNDDPSNVSGFEAAVRETVDRGLAPCVIWATIHFPGRDFSAVNARLKALAQEYGAKLQVVDWEAMADDDPALLAADGLHPSPQGAVARAQAYADAARRCPP
jgi:hypothetical protein